MRWAFLLVALALGGCRTAIHQVHVSDFGPYAPRSQLAVEVTAAAEQRSVLGFDVAREGDKTKLRRPSTAYVDEAWADLRAKCPGGDLTAISVETSTRLGFFSWTHHVRMRGQCRLPTPG